MPRLRPSSARLVCAAVVVTAMAMLPDPALAAVDDDLEAAQKRANRVVAELARAQTEMARTDDAVAAVQRRVAIVDRRVDVVRSRVQDLAIRLYVEGQTPMARILRMPDMGQAMRAQQLRRLVATASVESLGHFRAEREQLDEELSALRSKQKSRSTALRNLRERRSEAVKVIERLRRVTQAQAAAEARRTTQATKTDKGQPPPPRERVELASPRPAAAPPRASPTARRGAAPVVDSSAPWVCPVQGPRAFSNDYGAPRGGGSSHQGNDILAPRGTPVVANVAGVVTQRNGAVSGLAYYLKGDDGNTYFGAHLDSFGASGRVAMGTVIGTVGTTGDAAGGPPHLHFEIHPGGNGVTNPYPTLTRYC